MRYEVTFNEFLVLPLRTSLDLPVYFLGVALDVVPDPVSEVVLIVVTLSISEGVSESFDA